jgi:hypothetical protein
VSVGDHSAQKFHKNRTETSHLKSFSLIFSPHYVQAFPISPPTSEAKDSRFTD